MAISIARSCPEWRSILGNSQLSGHVRRHSAITADARGSGSAEGDERARGRRYAAGPVEGSLIEDGVMVRAFRLRGPRRQKIPKRIGPLTTSSAAFSMIPGLVVAKDLR